MGELQRPVAVTKPTQLQLESPIVAARWAACESFHKAVVARHRSYKKAKRCESKSGEHSSSASKSGARAQSESEAHTLSESADEWTRFRRAAAATSSQAKAPGSKKGKGSKGSAGLKDSKSSASAVAKAVSAKGSKRKGKGAGLAEKPRWDTSFKIPKRSRPDTSVSSGGQMPRKTDKFKRSAKKAAKKSSKSKASKDAQAKTGKGSATTQPSTSSNLPIGYWANHRPRDDTISPHAERVEWAGGLVLF